MKIIDTHLHLWDLNTLSLPWLAGETAVLNRTYSMSDYLKQLGANAGYEMEQAVYVEVDAAPRDRVKENAYCINLCQDPSSILSGAILSGDLTTPSFRDYFAPYLSRPEVKGVRHVLHVPSAAPGTCLEPDFIENVRWLGEQGYIFEACLRNEELGNLYKLAKSCPQTPIVLNHMGIVVPENIAAIHPTPQQKSYRTAWESNLENLSSLPNVVCKISGLNPSGAWDNTLLAPSIDLALETFGADRVMFASNYPVCNISTGLDAWIQALISITAPRGEIFQSKLFYDNAKRFYHL